MQFNSFEILPSTIDVGKEDLWDLLVEEDPPNSRPSMGCTHVFHPYKDVLHTLIIHSS